MSESFEDVMAELRKKCGTSCDYNADECAKYEFGDYEYRCNHCIEDVCGRIEQAHERDMQKMGRMCGDQMWEHGKALGEGNLELTKKSEYARGYEDGQRSMDADHQAVVSKLRRLRFDGGSHENLSKIAYAIYPCATGWTCESAEGLRDELVRLLGGVTTTDTTKVGDLRLEDYPTNTYDVHGNERHKAACRLRETRLDTGSAIKKLCHCVGLKWESACPNRMISALQNRLLYLFEDECTAFVRANLTCQNPRKVSISDAESEPDVPYSADMTNKTPIDGTQSNDDGTCPNAVQPASITDELRECVNTATKSYDNTVWYDMGDDTEAEHTICYVTEAELLRVADRIDAEFARLIKQQDDAWQATCEELSEQHDKEIEVFKVERHFLREEIKKFQNACNELRRRCESLKNGNEQDVKLICAEVEKRKLERECQMYRDMLNDAAAEFSDLMKKNNVLRLENEIIDKECDLAAGKLTDMELERKRLEAACDAAQSLNRDMMDGMLERGVPVTDENMARYGWIRLPVDKYGEYIHLGDELVTDGGNAFTVSSFEYTDWSDDILLSGTNYVMSVDCTKCRLFRSKKADQIDSLVTQHTLGNLDTQQLIDKLREVMDGER